MLIPRMPRVGGWCFPYSTNLFGHKSQKLVDIFGLIRKTLSWETCLEFDEWKMEIISRVNQTPHLNSHIITSSPSTLLIIYLLPIFHSCFTVIAFLSAENSIYNKPNINWLYRVSRFLYLFIYFRFSLILNFQHIGGRLFREFTIGHLSFCMYKMKIEKKAFD